MQQQQQQQRPQQTQRRPNYQMARQPIPQNKQQNMNNIPIPVINLLQDMQHKQMMRNNAPIISSVIRSNISSPMSPLSLNVSPMYSLPSSPNSYTHSPAMSPAQRERVMSPYTPQSMSPVGKFQQYSPGSKMVSPVGVMQGCDPYLNNKMQHSPNFPLQAPEIMLDNNVPLTTNDFWSETDIIQGASDLLTALDDVKLV